MKIVYYIIYPLWYLFSLLPLRVHYFLSDILFHLLYHLLRYRRRIVHKNLVESFPEKSEEEITKYVQKYNADSEHIDIVKFVPASGAASRMFKDLFVFVALLHHWCSG